MVHGCGHAQPRPFALSLGAVVPVCPAWLSAPGALAESLAQFVLRGWRAGLGVGDGRSGGWGAGFAWLGWRHCKPCRSSAFELAGSGAVSLELTSDRCAAPSFASGHVDITSCMRL